jgi:predicted lipoprotein with Yx(FWY)xxD motif
MTIDQGSTAGGDSGPTNGRGSRWRVLLFWSLGAVLLAVLGTSGLSAVSAATPTVQLETNPTFGPILAAGSGLALYTLTTDHNGQSTCHGSCAAVWPPLDIPVGSAPTVGPGVTGTVAASMQSDGTLQVTFNGDPVYTFVGDTSAGQVTGNGVSDFFVVKLTTATTTTTTTAAPAPGGAAPPPGPTSPASAPTSTGSSTGPATAPSSSGGTAAGATSASPATLAFTGTGSGLLWAFALGIVLLMTGSVLALGWPRRSRRWRRTSM